MKAGRLRGPLPASAAPPGGSWSLEVQIHPADIRKRVRYLFLTRRQLTLWSILVLLYVGLLAVGAAVAPGVISGLFNRQEYRRLLAERSRQGDRLQALVDRMDQLDQRAGGLGLEISKVFLVFGLPSPAPRLAPTLPSEGPAIFESAIAQGDRTRAQILRTLDQVDRSLGLARAFEAKNPEQVRATPSTCPLTGREFVLVSSFGQRRSPFTHEMEAHSGVDLAASVGTPVYASADGVVAFAGKYPVSHNAAWWRFGNLVMVENGDGFVTIFGHLDEIAVRKGARLARGDRLGTVGNTGWSTSPHLHYEIRRKGPDGQFLPVDPLIYILDHRWPNEDRLILRAKSARPPRAFEPLPSSVGR
ncbi:MAG: M23 family metallopeptidase [Thermoanaerobaculia bacterium]